MFGTCAACSKRLAFGYVDHPPFSLFVLRVACLLLGDGMIAFRLPPALAAGATALVVGSMARRLGAGALGQSLAAASVICSPLLLLIVGFYSMNAFEILLWALLGWTLIEIDVVGHSENDLRRLFEEVTLFRTTISETAMSWRAQMPVWIVRRPRNSLAAHWQDWKHYE